MPLIPEAGQCMFLPFKYTFNSTWSYVMPYKVQKINKKKPINKFIHIRLLGFLSHRQILTPLCKPQHPRKSYLTDSWQGLKVNKWPVTSVFSNTQYSLMPVPTGMQHSTAQYTLHLTEFTEQISKLYHIKENTRCSRILSMRWFAIFLFVSSHGNNFNK